ncbi:zinc-ribbon family protein [Pustulibacterium marinum]|uniref:Zinc-ribbon family protein n=1 Tax=Pustulibacterium marinum TaxID=1224947 RepID=A0A1I7G1V3_9FLAO|nr:zinc-ribbon domain-containing protein [Pustulibacterium marinum]SFU42301.1 zinc-ribbon family protein [Pustulibacterium marinum]
MIFYGHNSTKLATRTSKTAICPHCDTQGSITFHIFSKYAHIFWIPMFPYKKIAYSECDHCKQTLGFQKMPMVMQKEMKQIKEASVSPKWQFAGLGILVVLIIVGIISSKRSSALDKEYLETPIIGDVYEYKDNPSSYSTMKVVNVFNDSVYVVFNDYATNRMSGIDEIDIKKNYGTEEYVFGKEELANMYEAGDIYSVNRD